jgi:hypothetical protein
LGFLSETPKFLQRQPCLVAHFVRALVCAAHVIPSEQLTVVGVKLNFTSIQDRGLSRKIGMPASLSKLWSRVGQS